MPDSLNIWCNYPLPEASAARLRAAAAHHRLTIHVRDASLPPERDAPAPVPPGTEVIFGQPDVDAVLSLETLQWVHLSSAGYTHYDRDDVRAALRGRGAVLTNSSQVFAGPCAQHVAAMMLAVAHQLPGSLDNQRSARAWFQHDAKARQGRFLGAGDTVFIYGYGAIARCLVDILRPLGMRCVGVRRTVRGDEGVPMLTEAEADARLGEAGHVVNILPANDATRGFFGAARFTRFQPGARFYNIGRGVTVDQEALVDALRAGRPGVAYLDVTTPEPLPPEHPLWTTPNCYVTPHIAGAHAGEDGRLVTHFLDNLARYEADEALADRVF